MSTSDGREAANFGGLRQVPVIAGRIPKRPLPERAILMIYPKKVWSVVALIPAFALPAQHAPVTRSPAVPAAASESTVLPADKLLASWLAEECNAEVVLAQIAVSRTQSAEVEQFAKTLIAEHKKIAGELQPFTVAAEPASNARDQGRDAKELVKADRKAAEASSPGKAKAPAPFDHVALLRKLSQRCTAEQVKLLEAEADAEFDRSFMQAQVRAHMRTVIMAEVFHSRASSDLRPALEKIGKMLRSHLAQAKTLCKECEKVAADAQQGKQK